MKPKTKLVLNIETLVRLTDTEERKIVGGAMVSRSVDHCTIAKACGSGYP